MRQAERERLRAWLRSIGSKATSQEVDELQSDMQKLTKMAEDAIQAETGCFRLEDGRFIRLHPLAPGDLRAWDIFRNCERLRGSRRYGTDLTERVT